MKEQLKNKIAKEEQRKRKLKYLTIVIGMVIVVFFFVQLYDFTVTRILNSTYYIFDGIFLIAFFGNAYEYDKCNFKIEVYKDLISIIENLKNERTN